MYLNSRISVVVGTLLAIVAAPAQGQAVNEDQKIIAGDGGPANEFGNAIALDQGIMVVGAHSDDDNGANSGSAYLFNTLTGAQIAKLLPSDGAAGDEFGFSVAVKGGIVAVGAVRDAHNGVTSGSAYLFDASTGAEVAKLTPSDGAAGDEFGFAVALGAGVVAVGAKRDDDNGADSGSVYLFDASTGTQVDKLVADDGAANDNFGEAVAIDAGVVAVGAHGDWDNGPLSGSAYLFDVSSGSQIFKLLASDGTVLDLFGSSVAIDDGVVAVGAIADDDSGSDSGSAYVFGAGAALPGDLDGDGDVDLADHAAFVSCLAGPTDTIPAGFQPADMDTDGDCDLRDFDMMQDAFAGGA